jgi:hypothetical protein
MSFRLRPTLVLAFLSAAIAAPGAAHAATPDLSPGQVQLRAKLQAKQQARRQAQNQNAQYNLDIKPPELKRFSLPRTLVRVADDGQGELMVDLVATDSFTGVALAEVVVQSVDSSWEWSSSKSIGFPTGRANLGVPVSFSGDVPTGEWRVTSVILRDANGNVKIYDADALSAMGNTSFQVENRAKVDGMPPDLTGGSVLTPVVSRSQPPKGEYPDHGARVGVSLSVTDSGATKISGLSVAYVTLCDEFGWDCLYLTGSALKPGAATGQVVVGTVLDTWTAPTRYTVYSVRVDDRLGNARTYYQWDTDFGALFGGDASITVTE